MGETHISGPLFIGGVEVTPAELVGELTPDDVTLEADVNTIQVKAGGIDTAHLADDAVESAKIADDAVLTAHILDENVTAAKLDAATQALLGIVAAIPTADQNDSETIWNDGGVLKVSSAP